MDWKKTIYEHIVRELNINPDRDREAARILSRIICKHTCDIDEVKKILTGFNAVIVFGAGPSLQLDVETAVSLGILNKVGVVAADGAACALLSSNITPHVVVSDLDGPRECLLKACKHGSFMFIHAHGDNIPLIKEIVPLLLSGKILGTTQTEEIECIRNFGGFTDGDRAVLLCDALGCKRIILAGMDFGEKVGRYSKYFKLTEEDLLRKRKKLKLGNMVLEEFAKHSKAELYDATTGSTGINGFKKIHWRAVKELVE